MKDETLHSQSSFEQFVIQIEQSLHEVVDTGTDQQLFIASYLHGHFSLVVAQLQQHQHVGVAELDRNLQASLQSAFDNNELEASDQQQVMSLWFELKAQSLQ